MLFDVLIAGQHLDKRRAGSDQPLHLVTVNLERHQHISAHQDGTQPQHPTAAWHRAVVPQRLVEVLTFKGCPHGDPALALAQRVVEEMAADATVSRDDVPDAEAAVKERFLGSPTIRVNGTDIDPTATERSDYALSCRVYRTFAGVSGQPDEQWLRDALEL